MESLFGRLWNFTPVRIEGRLGDAVGEALLKFRPDEMFDSFRRRVHVVERQMEVLHQIGLP